VAGNSQVKTAFTQPKVARASTPSRQAHESTGIVQPALVVGLGQLGVETLAQLKKRIAAELGSPDAVPHVRVVAIDTDASTLQEITNNNPENALRAQETFHARLLRPSHYIKTRDGKLPTDGWLNPKILYRIPREQTSASVRALGRLAFVDNYRLIAKRLDAELHACCSQDTPHDLDPVCDLGVRTTKPRVYVVTSLTGSTGSGMFLDIAYLVRQLLTEHGHADAEIVGIFYLPSVGREGVLAPPLANAYASLVELQYYSKPSVNFNALYETAANAGKGERVAMSGPALQRCVLFSLPTPKGKVNREANAPLVAQAGDFLYRELATPLGLAVDKARANTTPSSLHDQQQGPQLQSVGMFQVIWPRHELLEQVARRLCTQLVTRWLSKDASGMADTIRQWTLERWESLGLRPEGLIERFQQLAEESLNQKPEMLLGEILVPMQELAAAMAKAAKNKQPMTFNMGPVIQTMDRLEKILGLPDDGRGQRAMHSEPALIERTLSEISHSLADECEQRLAELAVTLLEDPNYRLAGAEEALRQFCTTVDQALVAQETLGKELAEKAGQLHLRIHQTIDAQGPSSGESTQFAKPRRPNAPPLLTAGDLFELVRTYTKTRYHSLVLAHLNRLYTALRGHLSDQIREVGFCRQRLGELLGLLKPPPPKGAEPTRGDQRVLFPAGCRDLKDAVEKLSQTIVGEDLLAFDERMQFWIHNHCQALLQICMGASSMVRNLVPVMLQEGERYLDERLQGASVAEMYLARMGAGDEEQKDDSALVDDVQGLLEEATPEFGRMGHDNVINIVSLPNDEHGVALQSTIRKQFRDAKIQLTDRQDEMVFFREIDHIQWKDVEQLGPIALEVYQQRCSADPSSVHSREDVFEWQVIAECRR
ncbi:MAG TPA: tubulin-like doman-containing protein, partial [Gemmataceae bacterium]|nr:tubulin-like doman-containing protein [Gemmataceae bacterium]